MLKNKALDTGIIVLALSIYGLLLAQPINLVTADLGRHLKNGELIWSGQWAPLKTNLYSYTYPGQTFINHHWLSGVVFFLTYKLGGFMWLHLFYIFLSLAALFIFLNLAWEKSSVAWAGLTALLAIPLLLERFEVRPEVFSYFFSAVFLYVLTKFKEGKIKFKWLWLLAALEIIWVNLHIYFFLGLVIAGVFWAESLILKNREARKLALLFFILIAATLINPAGIKGTFMPFNIFRNFGYDLAENKPVWFIEKILADPNFGIFKVASAVMVLSFVVLYLKKSKIDLAYLIFGLGFCLAGWLAIRNFALFGFFAIPIAAGNLGAVFKSNFKFKIGVLVLLAVILTATASGEMRSLYRYGGFGLGLEPNNTAALDFFKSHHLAGPIFNNYDIGGYLIFGMYPQERVFTDNRPEAYPGGFFQKTYIPMQEDKAVWEEKSDLYKFNAIIFSYRDYTPWGQTFFRQILEDPHWATVFADRRIIILLKNNDFNKDIISKYGKPIKISRPANS